MYLHTVRRRTGEMPRINSYTVVGDALAILNIASAAFPRLSGESSLVLLTVHADCLCLSFLLLAFSPACFPTAWLSSCLYGHCLAVSTDVRAAFIPTLASLPHDFACQPACHTLYIVEVRNEMYTVGKTPSVYQHIVYLLDQTSFRTKSNDIVFRSVQISPQTSM